MATSTTFKGAPKPYGASGHFDEPQRHALQAKGIKTGNLSNSAVYEQYGITNLEKNAMKETPKTSLGLEDVQAETIEEKKEQPKKESFGEKFWGAERKVEGGIKELQESMRREKELKRKLKQEKLYLELGKKMPEPEPEDEDSDEDSDEEDYDSESLPAKLGTFLADVSNDYTSEDMVGLNDGELEMLAIRFKSQNKDSLSPFGEPENPFVEELKRRIEARDELRKEKAQLKAELKNPKKKEGFFDDIF